MVAKKKNEKEEITDAPLIIKDNQGEVVAQYDRKMINTIKNTVAKNATDEELTDEELRSMTLMYSKKSYGSSNIKGKTLKSSHLVMDL